MDFHPEISVIMPAYNAERYITESINSVISQTYILWELLVIDDGSTDNTSRRIEAFSDSRIRRITLSSNCGLTTARKMGIRESKGEFIAFLDADDIAIVDRLQSQIQIFESNPNIILCGSFAYVINENGDVGGLIKKPATNEFIKATLFFGFPFCTPTVMMRSSIAKKYVGEEFDDWQKADDYILFSRMLLDGSFINIEKPLLYYRIHNANNRITNDRNNADIVHGRMIAWQHQLGLLGLGVTREVLLLHDKLCYYPNRIQPSDIAQADAYLLLLAQMKRRNQSVRLLDTIFLSGEISVRVYRFLIHAGLSPMKAFWFFVRYRPLLLPVEQVKLMPNKLRRWMLRMQ